MSDFLPIAEWDEETHGPLILARLAGGGLVQCWQDNINDCWRMDDFVNARVDVVEFQPVRLSEKGAK